VNLLCNSERAILKYPNVFFELINVLYFQLKEMPDDFFSDIILQENFLTLNLHNLFNNIQEIPAESDSILNSLKEKTAKFKNYLEQRFKFDFDSCPDEYAAVVVDE
jgi:A1 cistron-splicing factor AAR2